MGTQLLNKAHYQDQRHVDEQGLAVVGQLLGKSNLQLCTSLTGMVDKTLHRMAYVI